MALYFGTTEITGIDNLVPQTGLDITDMWFGGTNVYTVWQTYDGTPPATFNANGADMRQYQIYGNAGGVGDRTVNEFDYKEWFDSGFVDYGQFFDYGIVQLSPYTTYTLTTSFGEGISGTNVRETNLIVTVPGESPSTSVGGLSNVSPQTLTTNDDGKIFIYKRFKRNNTSAPSVVAVTESMFENGQWINIIEGTTAQTEHVPFGYEVDMSVKSGNRFDYRDYVEGYYISSSGVETEASHDPRYETSWINHSGYISISPDESYTISAHHQNMAIQQTVAIAWYDESKIFISRDSTMIPKKNAGSYSFTATAPQNAQFAIFNFFTDDVQRVMFNPGSTPLPYQPYFSTVIPIYIGDDPLDKDEYVDYAAQKVYRKINDTLTPTDPPVPLPALPTCEGTTIVDYAGSGIAPEKVLLKYRKEGYGYEP